MAGGLTSKQRRFVDEFALSRNGAAAAARAGYAHGSAKVAAARLLTKANVQAALGRREAAAARALEVTRQRVIQELQDAVELAKLKNDPMAMVAAWREIAKICGLYAPERQQLSVSTDPVSKLARLAALSDAQLLALIDAGTAA